MSLGTVLPSVATKCPHCKSLQLRRSRWHRGDSQRPLGVIFSPYRCESCGKRFFKLSHRFESMMAWGAGITLVLGAIVVAAYVMHMDWFDIAALKRTQVAAPVSVPPKAPLSQLSTSAPAQAKGVAGAAGTQQARAVAGDAQAQYELGTLYLNGEGGVAKNYAEALKWLELAANGGQVDARYNLGIMYKTGLGALQNFEQSFHWFELAAGQNHAEAQYNVALMYKSGMSVPVDVVKAYTWANIAAVQGHIGAITLRDNLLGAMSPQQITEAQRASREWKPSDEKPKVVPVAAAAAKS